MSERDSETPKEKAAAEADRKQSESAAEEPQKEQAKAPWEENPAAPEWQDAEGDGLVEALRGRHGKGLRWARRFAGDLVLGVEREAVAEIARDLKEVHGYRLLVDICGAHYPKREECPLEVVYIVYNLKTESRIRFKVETAEGQSVPSVTEVWAGANWTEREVFDMYGVTFDGHPDMTRILLWEGFNGHPLRKDFPVEGIDTGAAIYPEYYETDAGPVAGTGTGWKPPKPPGQEPDEVED
jgi:NADH-quinone oxidoreductase subunit C